MQSAKILRLPAVLAAYGKSRSSFYGDIGCGLAPRPIALGARSVGWPAHEVDALLRARIRGATEIELRDLVLALTRQRAAEGITAAVEQEPPPTLLGERRSERKGSTPSCLSATEHDISGKPPRRREPAALSGEAQ